MDVKAAAVKLLVALATVNPKQPGEVDSDPEGEPEKHRTDGAKEVLEDFKTLKVPQGDYFAVSKSQQSLSTPSMTSGTVGGSRPWTPNSDRCLLLSEVRN